MSDPEAAAPIEAKKNPSTAPANYSKATAAVKKSPGGSKEKGTKGSNSHPTYLSMVTSAIIAMKKRDGFSRLDILYFILAKYPIADDTESINNHIKRALKQGVTKNKLKLAQGCGASGSFPRPFEAKSVNKRKNVARSRERKTKVIVERKSSLATRLWDGYTAQRHTDCILVSRDGREFPAHRYNLTAGSSVFAAMFQHDMQEKRSGVCKIDDIDGNILEIFLEFLHTDQANSDRIKDILQEVYTAADKYSVVDLCVACEHIMVNNLSAETALSYLKFAADRGIDGLKLRASEFLNDDNGET